MPTTREIKRRINSVKNINQVTSALEAVSASRVRRAQAAVLASRPYAQFAYDVLVNVAAQNQGVALHPLLETSDEVRRVGVVLITGDRGLAGAYNANIVRRAIRFVEQYEYPVRWITIGRKGRDLIRRWMRSQELAEHAPGFLKEQELVAEFSYLPADPGVADVAPITQIVFDDFLSGAVDEVFVAYTHFINTMTQQPRVLPLLPLRPFEARSRSIGTLVEEDPTVTSRNRTYIFEPDAMAILDEVIPRFTELQLLQAIRESLSSEHSARMVAMRNASESAEALGEALQLEYNKVRQLVITSEILDIIGGVEALAQSE